MGCKLQTGLTNRTSVQVAQTQADIDYHTLTAAITKLCIPPGCGAAMEDLPYLEILCVSDATSNAHQSLAAEGGAHEAEEGSAARSPQSYEKQGSLIALAWSKPPEEACEAEAAGTGQSQDVGSSLKTRVQPSDIRSTAEHTQCAETSGDRDREDLEPTLFKCGSTGHPGAQSADQQCSQVGVKPTIKHCITMSCI